jgi:hypothetical protein
LNVEISEAFFFVEFFLDHFQGVREKDDFFWGWVLLGRKKGRYLHSQSTQTADWKLKTGSEARG